jgi:hypothetical protein
MIDYLVGISQNLVAEVIIVGFTLGVWQFLKRRWKTVRPAVLSQSAASIERHLTRGLAFLLLVVALFVTRIDDAMGGVGAAFVALTSVGAGAICLGGLLHVAFGISWLKATRIGYWLTFVATAVAWATDPHVLFEEWVPLESARAFGLVAAGVALLGVQSVPLWISPDPNKKREPFPWRNLFLFSVTGTAVGAILLRHTFTWQEALARGPITGVLVTFGVVAAFNVVLSVAQGITKWADRHGWISYSPPTEEEKRESSSARPSNVATPDEELLMEVPASYLTPAPETKPEPGAPAEALSQSVATISLGRKTELNAS